MNEVFEAALEVQNVFDEQGWHYCIIGGLAVIRWGEPRTTRDADFTLLTGFGDEDRFLDVLVARFDGRYPNEADFARAARVYRGFASNGAEVDIALAAFPYEAEVISRATPYKFRAGCVLKTCSVDDLIVMKAFAGRHQDWADIENVAISQWKSLDWEYIERNLIELSDAAENLASVPKLTEVRAELEQRLRPKRS
jgi:hypothetical protein